MNRFPIFETGNFFRQFCSINYSLLSDEKKLIFSSLVLRFESEERKKSAFGTLGAALQKGRKRLSCHSTNAEFIMERDFSPSDIVN